MALAGRRTAGCIVLSGWVIIISPSDYKQRGQMSKLSLNSILVVFLAVAAIAALSGGIALVVLQSRSSGEGLWKSCSANP